MTRRQGSGARTSRLQLRSRSRSRSRSRAVALVLGATLLSAGCALPGVSWTPGAPSGTVSRMPQEAPPSASHTGPAASEAQESKAASPTATPSPTHPPEGGEVTFPSYARASWIPMPQSRLEEMRAYSRVRYGIDSYRLKPSMIVLHFTDSTAQAAINHFAQDIPNGGVLPGVCAHYVLDQDGTIHQLVPTNIMCRHAIGVNDVAIGIEVAQETYGNSAQWADAQILAREPQMRALLALVADLQARFGIPTDRIAGHATANADPAFRDLTGLVNDHSDWQEPDVLEFRRRLDAFVAQR